MRPKWKSQRFCIICNKKSSEAGRLLRKKGLYIGDQYCFICVNCKKKLKEMKKYENNLQYKKILDKI